MRKENFKEFTKNAEKWAKTMGTVGSMKNHKDLKIQELCQWLGSASSASGSWA
jgi:hypothetical protein